MTVKLIMHYPRPLDPEAFERGYHGHHMPLMRRLVGPDVPLPTWKVDPAVAERTGIYRVAEIVFPDRAAFDAVMGEEAMGEGRASATALSTGGRPTWLIVEMDEPGV